jgi:hypothetical protein
MSTDEKVTPAELVFGDLESIKKCMEWFDRLTSRVESLIEDLARTNDVERFGAPARAVILSRLQYSAEALQKELEDTQYTTIVTRRVIGWAEPLLKEAAVATQKLAVSASRGIPPLDVRHDWVSAIQLPKGELAHLGKLLVVRMAEIIRNQSPSTMPTGPSAAPNAEKDGLTSPDVLNWNGKKHYLQPRVWQLLCFLWDKDQVETESVVDNVWQRDHVADSTIRSTVYRLNEELAKAGVPWEYELKSGYIRKVKHGQ